MVKIKSCATGIIIDDHKKLVIIYQNFGHISNLSQIVDIFPHERFDSVMRAIETFEIMSKCVSQDQCLKDENNAQCMWPRYHACIQSLDAGKFQGINISHENEDKAYFTKLTQKKRTFKFSNKTIRNFKKTDGNPCN